MVEQQVEVFASYYQYYLLATEGEVDFTLFAEANDGVLGPAAHGTSISTGCHTGWVDLTIRIVDGPVVLPVDDPDVVAAACTIDLPDGGLMLYNESGRHGFRHDFGRPLTCAVLVEVAGRDEVRDHEYDDVTVPRERHRLTLSPVPLPNGRWRTARIDQAGVELVMVTDHVQPRSPEQQDTPFPMSWAERQAASREAVERASSPDAVERARAAELASWDGRLPSPAVLGLGGNAATVAREHRSLVEAFDQLGAAVQREATVWLARRAVREAGIDQWPEVMAALDAIASQQRLPAPFTSSQEAFACLLGDSADLVLTIGQHDHDHEPVRLRAAFAVPALLSAAPGSEPLQAFAETFSHTEATVDPNGPALVEELRQRFLT